MENKNNIAKSVRRRSKSVYEMFHMIGSFEIITLKAGTKREIRRTPVMYNTIMSSDTYGKNLIARRMLGDVTYPIEIDSAGIGTGTTTPSPLDVALETPVVQGILRANQSVAVNVVTIDWFIPDGDLTNDTYTEFAMFMNLRIFARSLFTVPYVKGSGEDTIVRYTITL